VGFSGPLAWIMYVVGSLEPSSFSIVASASAFPFQHTFTNTLNYASKQTVGRSMGFQTRLVTPNRKEQLQSIFRKPKQSILIQPKR
jgi:hypothetical protein